jgi:cytochrome c biogenesis protein CcmG/thiol:disulfide interchange protein DsbE
MRRSVRYAGLAAVALALVAVGAGLVVSHDGTGTAEGDSAIPAKERRTAPELEGEVLVPPPIRLSQLRGKPVVVNFWASWCVPCRKEAPRLSRFANEMRPRAHLIGVNFQDTKPDALAFVHEFRWRFPNVRDPNGELARRYRLIGLPTTYIIDREGRVARALTGEQRFDSLRRAVTAVE